MHHAAAVLGANSWRRLIDVDLRRLRPALVAALGLIVAVSLGEFGAASMLSRDGAETMPVAIARLLSRTGDEVRTQAFAMASLLVVVCVIALITVEASLKRGEHARGR
jgi:thiamine transport system permease protein